VHTLRQVRSKPHGLGPAYATAKLLQKREVTLDQIDLIEINEAFAGQFVRNEGVRL